MNSAPYIGRFAPSPTGPLHAGSLVAAMASFLDARAHGGTWLVRMEDVDEARTVPGAAEDVLRTLQALGMQWDGEVAVQSQRKALYAAARTKLGAHVYPCGCSRKEIADSLCIVHESPDAARATRAPAAMASRPASYGARLACTRARCGPRDEHISFDDRLQAANGQDLETEPGDFVLLRADGYGRTSWRS
ncbi:MAG: glutamate--tRNA ligase family protein [Chthoniobacteraceae bacterium]